MNSNQRKLIENFIRRQVRRQLREFREAKVSMVMMSHLSDISSSSNSENRNRAEFVKWLIFNYSNTNEMIDPNEEYQKFLNRK